MLLLLTREGCTRVGVRGRDTRGEKGGEGDGDGERGGDGDGDIDVDEVGSTIDETDSTAKDDKKMAGCVCVLLEEGKTEEREPEILSGDREQYVLGTGCD